MSELPAPSNRPRKIRVVCISDTHNHAPGEGYTLPRGDILVHAGDFTNQGSVNEIKKAAQWLEKADFAVKIVVAGNHDLSLDQNYRIKHTEGWTTTPEPKDAAECRSVVRNIPGVTYLEHESAEIEVHGSRLLIFGSPYSLDRRRQNWAFQYKPERGSELWSRIPEEVDIVISHTPPKGIVDSSTHWPDGGCIALSEAIQRIKPTLVVCGHHHEGRGAVLIDWTERNREGGGDGITPWYDPGMHNKKQSLLDLIRDATTTSATRTALDPSRDATTTSATRTAIVNASIMKDSWSTSKQKAFNKAIVVDLLATTPAPLT